MRALLLFNPRASTADPGVRDAIASTLAARLDLDVEATKQRGHATHLAAGAVHEGIDVVAVHGGDGTVNEVVQAVAGTPVVLGVIPGGATNVLARALGLPRDPVAATTVILDRLRAGRLRTVGLGRVNGRYFAVNAGFGFDAAVVRTVERRPALKRRLRQLAYVWCGFEEFYTAYDRTTLPVTADLHGRGEAATRYGFCIAGNTDPYAYFGPRALRITPNAGFDRGLDLLGVRTLRAGAVLKLLAQGMSGGAHVRSPAVHYCEDLPGFDLRGQRPLPLQVDGDYAGEHTEARFEAVPRALRLAAGSYAE